MANPKHQPSSEADLIDAATIKAGCEQLKAAAQGFTTAGNTVESASAYCGQDALSVDNASFAAQVSATADAIKQKEADIAGIADSIAAAAQAEYIEEYNWLQEQKEKKKKK